MMELTHTFRVAGPIGRVWAVLTDGERVARCLPGAVLLGVDGEDHRGVLTVTVGPVTARYEGVARFAERDDDEHHAVLRAEGRDALGQGDAAATVDLRLAPRGDGTEVAVVVDLELAGRMARFGRGVIGHVSGTLVGRFAVDLEEAIDRDPATHEPVRAEDARPVTRARPVEPVDGAASDGGAVRHLIREPALSFCCAGLGLLVGWLAGRAGGHRATRVVAEPPHHRTPREGKPMNNALALGRAGS